MTNTASPFYGQAGIEPGTPGCENATAPCTDNPDYKKAIQRTPRLLRVALKITF